MKSNKFEEIIEIAFYLVLIIIAFYILFTLNQILKEESFVDKWSIEVKKENYGKDY